MDPNTHHRKLANKQSKEELLKAQREEKYQRVTLSFYRYTHIENPTEFRNQLYIAWNELNCLGRIYIAKEGINAQMSVPKPHWDRFVQTLQNFDYTQNVPLKIAVEEKQASFIKLIIKIKKQIVADGLSHDSYNLSNIGKHLSTKAWNRAMEDTETVVVDMRNHYESEVGHFEGALLPEANTFKEAIGMVETDLKDKKDKKILLYCTGGIRCEKASAYLKSKGFEDVNQLNGGIIQYAHEVKEKNLPNKFRGKNFVFDDRLGERISDEVISHCHQCGASCDAHTNCKNQPCNLLFIQCEECREKHSGCCSKNCISQKDGGVKSAPRNKIFHNHRRVRLGKFI